MTAMADDARSHECGARLAVRRRWALICCAVQVLISQPSLADEPAKARTDSQVYQQYCAVCHATGWNEAPVTGVTRDWRTRLADGIDSLVARAKQGINAMPPMGTCVDCSDAELRAAIELMLKE